jgi:hypothetical protein
MKMLLQAERWTVAQRLVRLMLRYLGYGLELIGKLERVPLWAVSL